MSYELYKRVFFIGHICLKGVILKSPLIYEHSHVFLYIKHIYNNIIYKTYITESNDTANFPLKNVFQRKVTFSKGENIIL